MRITIESTVSEPIYSTKAVVEVPYDDLDIHQVEEQLKALLVAYGFHPDTVDELFYGEEDTFSLPVDGEEAASG
jgi:hypothetical protein